MSNSVKTKILRNLKSGTLIKNTTKAVKNRLIKSYKYHNVLTYLDPFRVLTKKIQRLYKDINTSEHLKVGNYYINKNIELNEKSIVYSLGVGTYIDFDIELAKLYNCNIYMYDPTPISIEFMKQFTDQRLIFYPLGIWKKEKVIKFYKNKYGGSSSIFNNVDNILDFEAKCITMIDAMKTNNHKEIDLIKIDIEGAGLEVLKSLLNNKIYPKQILIELERLRSDNLFDKINNLNSITTFLNLISEFYTINNIPQNSNKYFSIELLMTKKNIYNEN